MKLFLSILTVTVIFIFRPAVKIILTDDIKSSNIITSYPQYKPMLSIVSTLASVFFQIQKRGIIRKYFMKLNTQINPTPHGFTWFKN